MINKDDLTNEMDLNFGNDFVGLMNEENLNNEFYYLKSKMVPLEMIMMA